MKLLFRMGLVALTALAVYWFTVPSTRVLVRANSWEAGVVDQVWHSRSQGLLMFLNKASVVDRLEGLPVSDVTIVRERPWNATVGVDIADPDIVIRQGSKTAAVFLKTGTAYILTETSKAWNVVDVKGFPSPTPAFLAASLNYAPMCCQLMEHRAQLGVASMSLSSSMGLTILLKDGKKLILGDSTNGTSKIERGIAVLAMPAFKGKKVTIDLRFDGQAVIPANP
ncbi:MAG: cell division protein FtsQ/DivIB [Candidatus Cryosericum sp.]